MKRSRAFLVSAFVASVIAGCDEGLKEGMPKEPGSAQPSGFQAEMEKNSKNMVIKSQPRPKNAPASAPGSRP